MNTLGERLKAERTKRNWTLNQVANKLGLKGHSTYSNWEYGKREPDSEMLRKLAELYDVSTDYLLGITDSTKGIIHLESQSGKTGHMLRKLAEENIFFKDIGSITPEEAEELKKHLEFLRYKAKHENDK